MPEEDLNDFSTRTTDHVGETESVNALHQILKDPHFILRKIDERDYGIDLLLEVLHKGNASGWFTTLQVKSVSTRLNGDGSISRSVERTNLNTLLSAAHSMYIIYHREDGSFRYRFAHHVLEECRASSRDWKTQKTVTVRCRDLLDEHSARELHARLEESFLKEKLLRTRGSYDAFQVSLAQAASDRESLDSLIEIVMREASLNYERGKESIGRAKYESAAEGLEAALRLALPTRKKELIARIETALGGALVFLGSIPRAIAHLHSALLTLTESQAADDQVHAAFAYGNLALAKEFQGSFEEAGESLGKAISILELHAKENVRDLANMYLLKAQNILHVHEMEDVEPLLNSFFDCLDRISQAEAAPMIAVAWGVYGKRQLKLWAESCDESDLRMARTYFERALAVAQHWQLPELELRGRHSLAQCVWFGGDNEQARPLFLKIADDARAADYPLVELDARHDAAGVLLQVGPSLTALDEVRRVKDGYERLGGHPNLRKINMFLDSISPVEE